MGAEGSKASPSPEGDEASPSKVGPGSGFGTAAAPPKGILVILKCSNRMHTIR
eukprot:m.279881 g.279881  ORF g.279881 m.279881 type:complete len:53 (-) comp19815_c0_seq2:1005-1163(-)